MNKYRAVGFDYFGVIVGGPANNFNQRIPEITGVSLEEYKVAYHHHNYAFNIGQITMQQLWQAVLQELGKLQYLQQVLDVANEAKELNMQVIDIIKELKNKGYKVGLLSNATKETAQHMREIEHLDKLFDVMWISAEMNLAKPHKDAFLDFVKCLQVEPEELIFIDDAKLNLTAAEELGIKTIWCNDPANLRTQLQDTIGF